MNLSLPNLLLALIAFAIAFGVAKLISNRKRRRDGEKSVQVQQAAQSRQVRRARDRKNRR